MPRSLVRVLLPLLFACLLGGTAGCKRPRGPAPVGTAASVGPDSSGACMGAAPPEPPAVRASFAPPDHWSTITRDPKTAPLFDEHPRQPLFVAASMESDDGPEGELYLEREGDALFGRWGLTVVDGKLGADGKAFGLRDVGTEQMIFEGELEGGTVTGVIGAESMLRRVHSLPARSLAEASFRLTHSEGPRLLTLEVQAGEVKRATFSTFGKNAKQDAPFTVRREPDRLVIVGEKVEWSLWPTASGVLGRSASGRLVSQDHTTSSDDPKPLPFTRGDVVLGATHLRKGKPNTKCNIDVELPTAAGFPNAPEVAKALTRAIIEAGAGMWPSGDPPPTVASFVCQNDPSVDIQIQSASTYVTPLPGGFLGLEVKGYARFASVGAVSASSDCLLLDTVRGELVPDLLNKLPDELSEAVRLHADRTLKRDLRSAKLDRDDFYVVDSLATLSSRMSVCPTARGLRLLIPLGTITKSLGGSGPLAVEVPRRHLVAHLPNGHRFRPLFAEN